MRIYYDISEMGDNEDFKRAMYALGVEKDTVLADYVYFDTEYLTLEYREHDSVTVLRLGDNKGRVTRTRVDKVCDVLDHDANVPTTDTFNEMIENRGKTFKVIDGYNGGAIIYGLHENWSILIPRRGTPIVFHD